MDYFFWRPNPQSKKKTMSVSSSFHLMRTLTKCAMASGGILGLTTFGHFMRVNIHEKTNKGMGNGAGERALIIGDKLVHYELNRPDMEQTIINHMNTSGGNMDVASKNEQTATKREYMVIYLNETGNSRPIVPKPLQLLRPNDANNRGLHLSILSYDRPGTGFSDLLTTPRHAFNSAFELQSLLSSVLSNNNNKDYKYILVCEGYGSIIGRLFATQFKQQFPIAGMVLIDPIVEKSLENESFRQWIPLQMKQAKMLSIMSNLGLVEWLNLFKGTTLSNKSNDWKTFIEERKNLIKSCRQAHDSRDALNGIPLVILNHSHGNDNREFMNHRSSSMESNKKNAVVTGEDDATIAYMKTLITKTNHPLSEYREIDTSHPVERQREVCTAIHKFIEQ